MAKATTQVNTWEAELAKSAVIAAKAESKTVDRPFISFGNGTMSLQGAAFPGNAAAMIVLDSITANLYYGGVYDSSNPVPPECFAFGRTNDEGELEGIDTWDGRKELAPHKSCAERQHTECASCPMNQFGSAQTGKGKACQNTRRVAVCPAGTLTANGFEAYTKPQQITDAQVAYIKLPTMSTKGFGAYVMQVAGTFSRPLWGMFTKVARINDPRSQFVVECSALKEIPNTLMEATFKKHLEAKEDISFPFALRSGEQKVVKKLPAKRKYT